ncbi:MAG: hypothetical protein K2Q10_03665 [Rhodospirillales bacterium]|nr:hypothetical protein [Rhodospirillales bacterium]
MWIMLLISVILTGSGYQTVYAPVEFHDSRHGQRTFSNQAACLNQVPRLMHRLAERRWRPGGQEKELSIGVTCLPKDLARFLVERIGPMPPAEALRAIPREEVPGW